MNATPQNTSSRLPIFMFTRLLIGPLYDKRREPGLTSLFSRNGKPLRIKDMSEVSRRMAMARHREKRGLALPCLEPAVGLIDDVSPAATADDAAVPVARLKRLQ